MHPPEALLAGMSNPFNSGFRGATSSLSKLSGPATAPTPSSSPSFLADSHPFVVHSSHLILSIIRLSESCNSSFTMFLNISQTSSGKRPTAPLSSFESSTRRLPERQR